MKTMGQRIKEQRIQHNLTQEELAQAIGVSRQTISLWEKGAMKYIDRFKVDKMAEFFGCDPGWLMNADNAKNVMITYQADDREPVTMRISDDHDHPIIGTTALKVKLYKTVAKIPPELYESVIEILESLIEK